MPGTCFGANVEPPGMALFAHNGRYPFSYRDPVCVARSHHHSSQEDRIQMTFFFSSLNASRVMVGRAQRWKANTMTILSPYRIILDIRFLPRTFNVFTFINTFANKGASLMYRLCATELAAVQMMGATTTVCAIAYSAYSVAPTYACFNCHHQAGSRSSAIDASTRFTASRSTSTHAVSARSRVHLQRSDDRIWPRSSLGHRPAVCTDFSTRKRGTILPYP